MNAHFFFYFIARAIKTAFQTYFDRWFCWSCRFFYFTADHTGGNFFHIRRTLSLSNSQVVCVWPTRYHYFAPIYVCGQLPFLTQPIREIISNHITVCGSTSISGSWCATYHYLYHWVFFYYFLAGSSFMFRNERFINRLRMKRCIGHIVYL